MKIKEWFCFDLIEEDFLFFNTKSQAMIWCQEAAETYKNDYTDADEMIGFGRVEDYIFDGQLNK